MIFIISFSFSELLHIFDIIIMINFWFLHFKYLKRKPVFLLIISLNNLSKILDSPSFNPIKCKF